MATAGRRVLGAGEERVLVVAFIAPAGSRALDRAPWFTPPWFTPPWFAPAGSLWPGSQQP